MATPIDEFTEITFAPPDLTVPSSAMFVESGLASVAGGDRTVKLDVSAASNLANNVAFDINTSGDGRAEYASGPVADGDLSLLYDGADLASDLGEIVEGININFLAFDDGFQLGMDVTVVVSDDADTADLTIPLVSMSLDPFELVFDLNSFSGIESVDRANLTSIEIMFEAMQGQDFVLDSIDATLVPEPTALALLGLGGAIFFGTYRLRRRR